MVIKPRIEKGGLLRQGCQEGWVGGVKTEEPKENDKRGKQQHNPQGNQPKSKTQQHMEKVGKVKKMREGNYHVE